VTSRAHLVVATLGLAASAGQARAKVFTNTDEVRACVPLASGDVLVGTGGGLVKMSPAGEVRRVWTASDGLPGTRIDALVADGDGDRDAIWVGTEGGLARWQGDAIGTATASKPVRDLVRFRDRTYVATLDTGIVELGGASLAMRGGNALARNRASSVTVADGALWAGTAAGLYQLRGARLERVEGPKDVTALVGDGATLWIGASDGVWVREHGSSPRLVGGGEIRRMTIVESQGRRTIVAAGAEGLVTVDRGRVVAMVGAPTGLAQAIASRGTAMCTGGLDGLYTRTHGGWHHAAKTSGPPSSDVSAMVADGGRLWVGTFDQGLAHYEAERGWTHIAGIDARINALALEPRPDGARVWIATAEGIMVVAHDGNVVRRLGRSDGLPSRSVLSIARLGDGRILAGTSVGAAFVDGPVVRRVGPRPPAPPAQVPNEPKRLDDRAIGNVWAIAEANGMLWLGTTTGVYRGVATPWTSKDGSDDASARLDHWQRLSVATGHLKDDWVTAMAVKNDVVWVGTYNGGVARIDGDTATQLGGGWVNPSGLTWDGDRLLASTMDGLVIGDGSHASWTAQRALPGRDTTAALRMGKALWVATRRGIASLD